VGRVASMGKVRNACYILVGRPQRTVMRVPVTMALGVLGFLMESVFLRFGDGHGLKSTHLKARDHFGDLVVDGSVIRNGKR